MQREKLGGKEEEEEEEIEGGGGGGGGGGEGGGGGKKDRDTESNISQFIAFQEKQKLNSFLNLT